MVNCNCSNNRTDCWTCNYGKQLATAQIDANLQQRLVGFTRGGLGQIDPIKELGKYTEDREKVMKGVKEELKPRVDLVPPEAILAVATILAFGAKKHGARSWEKGMDYSDNYAACQRHLLKWYSGEDKDPETGKSHLHHAATRLFFLIGSEERGLGRDDRPICYRNRKTKTSNPS